MNAWHAYGQFVFVTHVIFIDLCESVFV